MAKHLLHLDILGQRDRRKPGYTTRRRQHRQRMQQNRRDSLSLISILNNERDLGAPSIGTQVVAGHADYRPVAFGDERVTAVVVHAHKAFEHLGLQVTLRGEESQVVGAIGAALVERVERISISDVDGSHCDRGSIAEAMLGPTLFRRRVVTRGL